MRKEILKMRVVYHLALALPLGLILALVLGACGQTDERSQASHNAQVAEGRLPDFLAYMHNIKYDYEPADTPAELAARVDAVVRGMIVAVGTGQSYAPTPESDPVFTTSVLQVKVDQLLAGDARVVTDGSVYVEVAHPAFVGTGTEGGPLVPFDHAAFAATVPRAPGVFFLDDRTREPYWETILNEGAGRPPGARITAPDAQGFLIENGSGGLVSVMEPFEGMPPAWRELDTVREVVSELR